MKNQQNGFALPMCECKSCSRDNGLQEVLNQLYHYSSTFPNLFELVQYQYHKFQEVILQFLLRTLQVHNRFPVEPQDKQKVGNRYLKPGVS